MAVDYLSTLNSGGSGLNITQIVDSLVQAETVPKREIITARQEELDLSISNLGQLKSDLETFNANLGDAYTGQTLVASSTSSSVSIVLDDPWTANAESMAINVDSLATAQLMEFSGFTDPSDTLTTGTLTVNFGSWDTDVFTADADATSQTLTLDSTNNTLEDVATALNALDGVTARVLDKGDGTYSLSVLSSTGADNAIQFAGDVTELLTTDQSNELVSASDASIRVDGITVTRSSNEITDLIAGATITLNSTNLLADTVALSVDAEQAEYELTTLVSQLNIVGAMLKTATQRGGNGATEGPLVSDASVQSLKRSFANITTLPIEGFGDDPIYLSQIGVHTERDGTLTLDSEEFQAAFASDPSLFRAVFQSLNRSSSTDVTIAASSTASPPIGSAAFVYTDDTTATLAGEDLSVRTNSDGNVEFYAASGDYLGVSFTAPDGFPSTDTFYFGQSFTASLQSMLALSLANDGSIANQVSRYQADVATQADKLSQLEARETMLYQTYTAKFANMESIVTQLKSTGDYLTSMMDTWVAQQKG